MSMDINMNMNMNKNTFYKIIEQTIQNKKEKTNFFLCKNIFFYFSIQENGKNIKKKYKFLEKIDQNIFLSEEMKKEIWDIFSQCQKKYFAFSKFVFNYRLSNH